MLVKAAKFELNADYNESFEFKFKDGIAFKPMQMLWYFASTIDLNCNTVDKPERIDPASPEINFLLSITFSIDC